MNPAQSTVFSILLKLLVVLTEVRSVLDLSVPENHKNVSKFCSSSQRLLQPIGADRGCSNASLGHTSSENTALSRRTWGPQTGIDTTVQYLGARGGARAATLAAAIDTDVAPAAPPPLRLRLAPLVARAAAAAASARPVLRRAQRPRHRAHGGRVAKGGGGRGAIKVAVASAPAVLAASLAAAMAAAHVSAEVTGWRCGRCGVLRRARRCVLRQRRRRRRRRRRQGRARLEGRRRSRRV